MTGIDTCLDATWPRGAGRAPGRWLAAAAIEGVIVIHLWLTPMHLTEKLYIGVLFAVGNGLLLVGLALLFSRRRQTAGWLLSAAVCAGELVGFVLSRTVGLPMDYHGTWLSEREDYLGLASLLCEVIVLAVAAVQLRGVALRRGRRGFRRMPREPARSPLRPRRSGPSNRANSLTVESSSCRRRPSKEGISWQVNPLVT
jgi:hypothetical protein